jgi:hypothetical protein
MNRIFYECKSKKKEGAQGREYHIGQNNMKKLKELNPERNYITGCERVIPPG